MARPGCVVARQAACLGFSLPAPVSGLSMARIRVDQQPAYVLHAHPYRETSLVVEIFSRSAGRSALVARGARRPHSAIRGALGVFQPLLLSWFGGGEVHTLHAAEWNGAPHRLRGEALLCGFYLNELLLRLLPREDAHEALFDIYEATLARLSSCIAPPGVLRRFEKNLLQELGYGLSLDRFIDGTGRVEAGSSYCYVVEQGLSRFTPATGGVKLRGKTLIDLVADNYDDPVTLAESKQLMRMAINHCLGGQPLHTRQLILDLQEL